MNQLVRNLLDKHGLDAFLFSSYANVFYLSKLRASSAFFILTRESSYLLTDSRYIDRARALAGEFEVIKISTQVHRFLKEFLKNRAKSVGFESDKLTCESKKSLSSRAFRLVGISSPLREIRSIKTHQELEVIKAGVKKSDDIYLRLLDFLKPGLSELEVRAFLNQEFFKEGATGESFPAIIASGKSSAIPHWESSENKINSGKPLLLDFGMIYMGYCTDFTRTIYLGKAPDDFKKVYNAVKDAYFRAVEYAKAGVLAKDLDSVARETLKSYGLDKFFTHSLGHGVGIEIHEFPRISQYSIDTVLKPGMVITIEPGVYIPGEFGVRLENMVLISENGSYPLSNISLDLIEL
ncbi:MAG: Xaa-Pro peptidase family protein [Aquificaceae bacterium]